MEKNQSHILQGSSNPLNTYNNKYDYVSSSHKISRIKDQLSGRTEEFSYDLNGNITQRVIPTLEYNYGWDEENRLRTFTKKDKLGETTHLYYYDASGERIIKIKGASEKFYLNSDLRSAQLLLRDFTVYPSAFLTQSDSKITKHYYAGTKRIASRIEMKTATEPRLSLDMELKAKQESDLEAIAKKLDCREYKYEFNQYEVDRFDADSNDSEYNEYNEANEDSTNTLRADPTPIFFYHPDHLGTSTVISNSAGAVHQYFFNLPFGETMIEGCTNTSYELNYKFNAKELDAESGLYYYGARYYDPRVSVWMSVDPMWKKNLDKTPYQFVNNNPFIRIDPNGKDDYKINSKGIVIKRIKNRAADTFYRVDDDGNNIEGRSISFKYGTIKSLRSQKATYMKRNDDGSRELANTSIDIYKIRSDENGVKLFEFMDTNTDVEWSNIKTGITGEKGLNFLTTGHIEYTEPGATDLLTGQLQFGYSIRELNHNHPSRTPYPSGLDDLSGDIGFATSVSNWYENRYPDRSIKPTYNIYVGNGDYIPYKKDSSWSDF